MSRQGMPLKIFVAGLLALLAGVCVAARLPRPANEGEDFEVVKTGDFEGVIVPRDKAKDFMKAFSGIEEKESWTPSKDDVLKLEEKIESYLKKAAAKMSRNLWMKLADYKRQYIGIMRNGRRVIFANFFCDAFQADWKRTPVTVEDGGDCFFNILYNPGSATFSDLRINGEA